MKTKSAIRILSAGLMAIGTWGCTLETGESDESGGDPSLASNEEPIHMGLDVKASSNDDPEIIESVVKLGEFRRWKGTESDTWPSLTTLCSAVAINANAIVTAGHCMADKKLANGNETTYGLDPGESAWFWMSVEARRKNGAKFSKAGWFFASLHPDYRDSGTRKQKVRGDIAILVAQDANFFNSADGALDAAQIWTASIYSGMNLDMYGWGPNSDSGSGLGTLRKGRDNSELRVDAFESEWLRGSSSKAKACLGDSGGPVLRWVGTAEAVVGIYTLTNVDEYCTMKDNAEQWYTRLAPKMGWIEGKIGQTCPVRISDGLRTCHRGQPQAD